MDNEIEEISQPVIKYKIVWELISLLFHPVFLPSIATFFYLDALPMFIAELKQIILYVVIGFTLVFPITLLFALKTLGLVESIRTTSISERKVPFIVMMGAFTFLGMLLHRIGSVRGLVILSFANVFALGITYVLFYKNIKSSIHMIGISALFSFSCIVADRVGYSVSLFAFLIFCCGLVATARLHLKAHTFQEVWIGALLGGSIPFMCALFL